MNSLWTHLNVYDLWDWKSTFEVKTPTIRLGIIRIITSYSSSSSYYHYYVSGSHINVIDLQTWGLEVFWSGSGCLWAACRLTPSNPVVIEVLASLGAKHLHHHTVEVETLHQHPGEGAQEEEVKQDGHDLTGKLEGQHPSANPTAVKQRLLGWTPPTVPGSKRALMSSKISATRMAKDRLAWMW